MQKLSAKANFISVKSKVDKQRKIFQVKLIKIYSLKIVDW
jgi:hypothetical protein